MLKFDCSDWKSQQKNEEIQIFRHLRFLIQGTYLGSQMFRLWDFARDQLFAGMTTERTACQISMKFLGKLW